MAVEDQKPTDDTAETVPLTTTERLSLEAQFSVVHCLLWPAFWLPAEATIAALYKEFRAGNLSRPPTRPSVALRLVAAVRTRGGDGVS